MTCTLDDIHVYPVKSCGGFSVSVARVGSRGIESDREWMIVDGRTGTFLTQREFPSMAVIETSVVDGYLKIHIPDHAACELFLDDWTGVKRTATVFASTVEVHDCGEKIADALSAFLDPSGERQLRLVRMARNFIRPKMTGGGSVPLADAFSFHGASRASLDDLNARLPSPLPMNRFRPNLVFEGCPAYAEDLWKRFRIGEIEFATDFKCIRCAITMIDQQTGIVAGPEPLATLAQYRKMGMKVVFGTYFTHLSEGLLRTGEAIEILETNPS